MFMFLIFFFFTLAKVRADEIATIADLDRGTVAELGQMLEQANSGLKANCKKVPNPVVNFLLYTRENPDNPTVVDGTFDVENKKTVLLIHGWLSAYNSTGIIKLRKAYLRRYDCNLIVMDWAQLSHQRYTSVFCSITRLAFHLSKFLCDLKNKTGISLKNVHMVGHSVGAQIAGVAGHYVKQRCKQSVARITGLDPAGPMYQGIPLLRRLDKDDADFVDVIHTDEFQLGYRGNTGSIDFHVNCGTTQPGCNSVKNLSAETKISDVMCSHFRSLELMAESVNTNRFVARSCGLCPRYCRPNSFNEVNVVMGENCNDVPTSANNFYISTGSFPPFYEDLMS